MDEEMCYVLSESERKGFITIHDMHQFKSEIINAIEVNFEKVRKRQEDMERLLKQLHQEVKRLKATSVKGEEDRESLILPKSPFTNYEDFQRFESSIEDNEEHFDCLVSHLQSLCSSYPDKFIKVCWRSLMDDATAENFSWKGTKDKSCVQSLTITAAIKKAYSLKFPQSTDMVFKDVCVHFFQQAKTRHTKRLSYQESKGMNKK